MRRVRDASSPLAPTTGLVIDADRRRVTLDGEPVTLTRLESALLLALSNQPGVVLSAQRLMIDVWGYSWLGDDHVVETHIGRLRAKLRESARHPRYIHTVRGAGYRFEPEPAEPHLHVLTYDAELVLVGLDPEAEGVLGWPREEILGRFFLLTAEDAIREDQQAAIRYARTLADLGDCVGPSATTLLDVSGERHVGSIMLCFSRTPEGDFAGMRSRLLLDNGRAARLGTWPTSE